MAAQIQLFLIELESGIEPTLPPVEFFFARDALPATNFYQGKGPRKNNKNESCALLMIAPTCCLKKRLPTYKKTY
jgi:hypothetical protein